MKTITIAQHLSDLTRLAKKYEDVAEIEFTYYGKRKEKEEHVVVALCSGKEVVGIYTTWDFGRYNQKDAKELVADLLKIKKREKVNGSFEENLWN